MLLACNSVVWLVVFSAISSVCGLGFFESIGRFVGYAEENDVQLTNEGYFAYLRQKHLLHPSNPVPQNSTVGLHQSTFVPTSIEKLSMPKLSEMEQNPVNSTVKVITDSTLNTSKAGTSVDHNNNNDNYSVHKEELVPETHSVYKNHSVGRSVSKSRTNRPVFDSGQLVSRVSFESPNLFTNTKNDTKIPPPKVDFQTTNQSSPYITARNKTKPRPSKPQQVENVFTVEYRNSCAIANVGVVMTFVGLFISIML